jgi:hypothetical protein
MANDGRREQSVREFTSHRLLDWATLTYSKFIFSINWKAPLPPSYTYQTPSQFSSSEFGSYLTNCKLCEQMRLNLCFGEFVVALVCHWHMTNSEDSQHLLGRILDFCVESMENCIGQYGRNAIDMKNEFPGSQGAPMDRSVKEASLLSVHMGRNKMPAKQAGIHAEVLHHVLSKAGGLGCSLMLKFNFWPAFK